MNQQDEGRFNEQNGTTTVRNVTNVVVPSRTPPLVVVPGTSFSATTNGFPTGFQFSEDPNGYIAQVWVGRRNERALPPPPNVAPVIRSVTASISTITRPCAPPTTSTTCTPTGNEVTLTVDAFDENNDTLLYTWSVTGGRLTGEGKTVTWDLSGVANGSYTATVEVDDGNMHKVTGTATVTVADCTDCKVPFVCPTVSVSCPNQADPGTPATFNATISPDPGVPVTYNWSVSAGTITGGQGTNSITVDTTGLGGQTVTGTVSLGGLDPSCTGTTASCSVTITAPAPPAVKFDEYGNIRFNDEKARLDNYAIQLQNQPGSTATIIVYGSCAGEAQTRGDRARDYLVNTRGIDAGRITVVDGGCRSDLTVQLWIVPAGATAPAADTTGNISPCPECKRRAAPRRRRGDE